MNREKIISDFLRGMKQKEILSKHEIRRGQLQAILSEENIESEDKHKLKDKEILTDCFKGYPDAFIMKKHQISLYLYEKVFTRNNLNIKDTYIHKDSRITELYLSGSSIIDLHLEYGYELNLIEEILKKGMKNKEIQLEKDIAKKERAIKKEIAKKERLENLSPIIKAYLNKTPVTEIAASLNLSRERIYQYLREADVIRYKVKEVSQEKIALASEYYLNTPSVTKPVAAQTHGVTVKQINLYLTEKKLKKTKFNYSKSKYNYEKLQSLYIDQGLSMVEAANVLGLNPRSARGFASKHKLHKVKFKDYTSISENLNEIKEYYLNNEVSMTDVAEKFGVCYGVLIQKFKQLNITKNKRYRNGTMKGIDKDEFIRLYVRERLTLKETAEKLGISRSTAHNFTMKYKINRKQKP